MLSSGQRCTDQWLVLRLWTTEALITGKQTSLEQKSYAFASGRKGRKRAIGPKTNFL